MIAVVAAPAEPTDRDAIADREILHAVTDFGDLARDLMSGRQGHEMPGNPVDEVRVGATDPARADRQSYLVAAGWLGFDFGQL